MLWEVTLMQHRKNGNFSKRRDLLLVWNSAGVETSIPMAGKDVIRKMDALLRRR